MLVYFALAVTAAAESPRLFLLEAESLAEAKERLAARDPLLLPALEVLRREAEEALERGPYTVTEKPAAPPSGDKRDYQSMGPYWWPDPSQPDGLPYIRRDGEVNPEFHGEQYDRGRLSALCRDAETLALAWYFTGEKKYASHAALLLRVWFLDEATRMNPHLKFGQAIPGRTQGRGIGIIDTVILTRVPEAAGLLALSPAWSAEEHARLTQWFRDYLQWLRESPLGREEDRQHNNHGTWYDVQLAQFALFVGEPDVAREVLQRTADRRIATQIAPDGRQPHELARTRSFDYSSMNLAGMFALARLGEHVGVDLWRFRTEEGRGLRPALDFLAPYSDLQRPWPHKQITPTSRERLIPLLR